MKRRPRSTQSPLRATRFVAQAYSNRGYIKLNALEVDNAIRDFTTAIKIDPDDPDHYYKRGLARLINEDLPQALEDLNTSLNISGPDSWAKGLIYATRGMVKLLQNRKVDAQKDFEEAIKLNEGKNFVESYLESLQIQIMLMRQLRAKQQKSIV